jgi:hypothetical protein
MNPYTENGTRPDREAKTETASRRTVFDWIDLAATALLVLAAASLALSLLGTFR